MRPKLIRFFLLSAGVILLITALAKFVSSTGHSRILQVPDPILSISFRHVFWVVGAIELIVSMVCFFGKRPDFQAGLVAWLVIGFVVYRLGVGNYRPCPCLGTLTDALHIPSQTVDTGMKILLAYLLIGSFTSLFWIWREKRNTFRSARSIEQ